MKKICMLLGSLFLLASCCSSENQATYAAKELKYLIEHELDHLTNKDTEVNWQECDYKRDGFKIGLKDKEHILCPVRLLKYPEVQFMIEVKQGIVQLDIDSIENSLLSFYLNEMFVSRARYVQKILIENEIECIDVTLSMESLKLSIEERQLLLQYYHADLFSSISEESFQILYDTILKTRPAIEIGGMIRISKSIKKEEEEMLLKLLKEMETDDQYLPSNFKISYSTFLQENGRKNYRILNEISQ